MALSRPVANSVDPGILESAARELVAGAITFRVDGDAITYAADGSTIRVDEGHAARADVVVRLG